MSKLSVNDGVSYKGIEDERDPVKEPRRHGCLVRFTVALTVLNFGLLVAVVAVTVMVYKEQTQTGEQGGQPVRHTAQTCIPCRRLREGVYSDPDAATERFSKETGEDGESMCCANNPTDLSVMISMIVERKIRIEKTKGSFVVEKTVFVDVENSTRTLSMAKPAAHLLGFYGGEFKSDRVLVKENINKDTLNRWRQNHDVSFIQNGIDYQDGRLIIPKRGLYYVYSQVFFSLNQTDDATKITHAFTHAIYRQNSLYTSRYQEKLLENAQSKCSGQTPLRDEHTSYLGAVLDLRLGDEIFVKISDLDIVVKGDHKSNYFGLYML